MNYSPSCRSKPVRPSFIFGTQIKIFLMKSESLHCGTVMSMCRILTRKKRNCWMKSLFLLSLPTKGIFRSFIKLQLNHWCHMDYFNDVLTTFLELQLVSCVAVYGGSESSRISLKISGKMCSDDERRSYGFEMTWGWVINDRIFILGELSL